MTVAMLVIHGAVMVMVEVVAVFITTATRATTISTMAMENDDGDDGDGGGCFGVRAGVRNKYQLTNISC